MKLSEDPDCLRHFTREELIAHEKEQRLDLRRLAARREKEVADSPTEVSRNLDFQLAESILGPIGLEVPTEKDAKTIASIFVGLQFLNRVRGTVRGGDFEESDATIFAAAAEHSKVPVDDALSLPAEVRARMRALVQ